MMKNIMNQKSPEKMFSALLTTISDFSCNAGLEPTFGEEMDADQWTTCIEYIP